LGEGEVEVTEFILEEKVENVISKNTKEYLKEVISSYNNGNYRAAVVVLYTAVIYDLLQKIVVLKEIYNDKGAEKILNDIKTQQSNNPKSPEWESNLIENVYKETKILTAVEKEELFHLKNERNYAAHPIITIDADNEKLELKHITKETVIDLIRKSFEIVFLRDAILAKNIVIDIVSDLNEFYGRVKTDGLENFLNTKYFRRMTQERKDNLFSSFWKFVFILSDNDCNKNRESNYWGLVFLYNENKNHYRNLMLKDENNYFNKLQLETMKSWSEKNGVDITYSTITYFKRISRIMYLIRFLEYAPEVYKTLNDYAKNILQQSINHMYIEDDVTEKSMYQAINKNSDLFKEQVKLKSDTVFLSDDISKHFNMIFRMLNNYMSTAQNWTEPNNYCILDEENIEIIFYQSEYRGCIEEFVTFLIKYCMGANTYNQASYFFGYFRKFKKYLKEEHYYMILAGMNDNSQYYDNRNKGIFIGELEKIFADSFDSELVKEKEEKYLYNKLYCFDLKSNDYSVDKILELIEKRAMNYSVWNLYYMIKDLLDYNDNKEVLKKYKPSFYPNILNVLSNRNDYNYDEYYVERFNNYFK
jgi:hypothetical protein